MCLGLLQVFPVSKKVHTTRCKAWGVVTHEDTQLVSCPAPARGSGKSLARSGGFSPLHLLYFSIYIPLFLVSILYSIYILLIAQS